MTQFQERTGVATLGGNRLHFWGRRSKLRIKAPDFTVNKDLMTEVRLSDYASTMEQIDRSSSTEFRHGSPQTPDHSLSMKEKHELCFHVLSDPGNKKAEYDNLKYKLPDYMDEFLRNVGMILEGPLS